jgi:hypothetical protein
MVDNDEKWEIARDLRRWSLDCLHGKSLQKALAEITEAQDTSWRGVMRRLADLIEP